MIDGPMTFVIMMSLLCSAIYGGFVLLVCIGAMAIEQLRRHAVRSLIAGAIAGGLALAGAVLLLGLALDEGAHETYLFILWGSIAFFAGFAWGAAFAVVAHLLWKSRRQPPNKPLQPMNGG